MTFQHKLLLCMEVEREGWVWVFSSSIRYLCMIGTLWALGGWYFSNFWYCTFWRELRFDNLVGTPFLKNFAGTTK